MIQTPYKSCSPESQLALHLERSDERTSSELQVATHYFKSLEIYLYISGDATTQLLTHLPEKLYVLTQEALHVRLSKPNTSPILQLATHFVRSLEMYISPVRGHAATHYYPT